jgi:hypothetical protein
MEYNNNLLKSVLLLTLAVSGNFVGNTLSCKSQYHMTNNMIVKHLLLYFIIFFTLTYTSSELQNPNEIFKNSFLIWLCFVMYTKQNIEFTVIASLLIVASYILNNYEEYYDKIMKSSKNNDDKIKNKFDSIVKYKKFAYNSIIATIIIGFSVYLYQKKKEYGDNFNITTFIFGKVACDSLK